MDKSRSTVRRLRADDASLGVLCGVETLVEKFVFGTMVQNPVILLAIFLFLIGIQSILMGILADLQMRTFTRARISAPIWSSGESVLMTPDHAATR